MNRVWVGTSGYQYRDWREVFYPPGLPARSWLPYYAQVFPTVEMNATFYRLPEAAVVIKWREGTPAPFVFACKGSRFLTHMKRLRDIGPGLERFFSRVDHLGDKLHVVLWQLPPQMKRPDAGRLDAFLGALPTHVRHAFEFRDPAWYTPEVCRVLDRRGVAFCEHDLVDRPPPCLTGGFRYLRFHGATAPYRGRYGKEALRVPAEELASWREREGDAFVYFNNDVEGHAARDALDLLALLGEPARLPAPPERAPVARRRKSRAR